MTNGPSDDKPPADPFEQPSPFPPLPAMGSAAEADANEAVPEPPAVPNTPVGDTPTPTKTEPALADAAETRSPPSAGAHRAAPSPGKARRVGLGIIFATVLGGAIWFALTQFYDQPIAIDAIASTTTSTAPTTSIAEVTPPDPLPSMEATVAIRSFTDTSTEPGFATGFVVGDGLHIATTHTTVTTATSIIVTTGDGAEREATLVGTDEVTNIALLEIAGEPLPVHQISPGSDDPASVAVGDDVRIVVRGTVIDGQVSALDERLDITDRWRLHGLIATDFTPGAQITGTPLLDPDMTAVGLLVTDASGIYAIPIAEVLRITNELAAEGRIAHGYLGVQARDLIGIRGAEIFALPANSPLQDAGAQRGDLIVEIDSQPVTSADTLISLLRTYREGDNIVVAVDRQGTLIDLDVTLNPYP